MQSLHKRNFAEVAHDESPHIRLVSSDTCKLCVGSPERTRQSHTWEMGEKCRALSSVAETDLPALLAGNSAFTNSLLQANMHNRVWSLVWATRISRCKRTGREMGICSRSHRPDDAQCDAAAIILDSSHRVEVVSQQRLTPPKYRQVASGVSCRRLRGPGPSRGQQVAPG